jgi:peptidyl-prolyl cis-trans isomerase D
MLQTISKHIQGWIAWIVIVIIAAAFVLWGLEYYISQGGSKQSAIATVNGVKITSQQLNNAYEAFQRNYAQQGMVLNESIKNQIKNAALQQLILDQALLQKAEKMGFSINPTEIQQVIWHIPNFQENGQFSPQRFQQALISNGIDQETFVEKITSSLVVEQLSAGLQKSSFVTPVELAQAYSLWRQQRDFGYFILPATTYIASAHPADAQISAYYQKHKDEFLSPEQVKVAYILLSPESVKSEIKVNPAEVSQYYQDHANEFPGKTLTDVKANIEARLSQQQLNQAMAAKSEQLEDLSYTNPSSLDNAAQALKLPVRTSDFMSRGGIKGDPLFSDPKVLAAISSDEVLKQKNNSTPIELKNGGFIVLRVAAHQPEQKQPLDKVQKQISQLLQKEQGQKQEGLVAYQIQHALESGESVAALSRKYQLKWLEKTGITREDKTLPPQLLVAVFGATPPTPPKKAITSILMADGSYAIIQVNSFHKANYSAAPLAEQVKLSDLLANRWGELDYQLFLRSVIEKAKIENLTK